MTTTDSDSTDRQYGFLITTYMTVASGVLDAAYRCTDAHYHALARLLNRATNDEFHAHYRSGRWSSTLHMQTTQPDFGRLFEEVSDQTMGKAAFIIGITPFFLWTNLLPAIQAGVSLLPQIIAFAVGLPIIGILLLVSIGSVVRALTLHVECETA